MEDWFDNAPTFGTIEFTMPQRGLRNRLMVLLTGRVRVKLITTMDDKNRIIALGCKVPRSRWSKKKGAEDALRSD